jgi:transcriptional regulator with XRE-family HTH domain
VGCARCDAHLLHVVATGASKKIRLQRRFFPLMLPCMEHLQTYLKTHKAKPLAEAVGISQSYLSDMKKGYRSPSLRVAVAIEDATEGAVPARAWVSK